MYCFQRAGKRYGYKPKCVKMHIVHMFMHYLVYGYTGDPNMDQSVKLEVIRANKLDESLANEMSFIYNNTNDWRMFVSPIPIHSGKFFFNGTKVLEIFKKFC